MPQFDPRTESDLATLAGVLRDQYPDAAAGGREPWPWPALSVVDAALAVGLGEQPLAAWGAAYTDGVAPRVRAFQRAHPGVRTLADLARLVGASTSPEAFARDALPGADPRRGVVVRNLTDYLRANAGDAPEPLAAWAAEAVADRGGFYGGDHALVSDDGFDYLRRLLGAPVAVPGPHVEAWAHEATGPDPFPGPDLLGLAAGRAGVPLAGAEHEVRRDYLGGYAWGERAAAPEAGAWVRYVREADAAVQREGTRWSVGLDAVTRLHARAPHRPPGADLAEPLARADALQTDGHASHGALANLLLHALYALALGHDDAAAYRLAALRRDIAWRLSLPLAADFRAALAAFAPEA